MKSPVSSQSYVKLQFKDVIMPASTVLTVTRHAPPSVKTTRVTYRMDRVLTVSLDGLECIVTQNVKKDGMVITVLNSVYGIVKTALPVIT